MINRCNFCSSYEEIVFEDYARGNKYCKAIFIKMCWRCATEFKMEDASVKHNIDLLFPRMIACLKCQSKFIPSEPWKTICTSCYKKSKEQPKSNQGTLI